ncbi:MAG: phosphate ABC transporter substrate-binding protein [SAR202 cluster bacterium Ae2-Chloro-G2]|nr:MAG: phosphate ABC transporter substrate-binding protein [SAR202 cluster bacterium Ae2-Chloro-G2]
MFYSIGSIRAGILFFGSFVLLLLFLTACGTGNSDSEASEYALNRNDSGMSGEIEIDGSSTVYPISEAVAEEFNKLYPNVRVNVGVSGTGGGFKRFTAGETDISDASRPMKNPGETSKAVENGIRYVELRLGTDGISVVVNLENTFVDCLTTEELRKIWEPGSSIDNWSQVRAGFPDQKMRLYGPDTDSGTFDYFTEEIMGEAQLSRPDYTASADDNVLIQGIAGDKGALGYFGYAYYRESRDKLKLVAVDNGSGCVLPSLTTIPSGEYSPLSRPLFLYINLDSLDRPEVKALVDFYMEQGPALTNEVGYVAASTEVYQNNMEMLNK